jgi:tryptophan synthase alpha chain
MNRIEKKFIDLKKNGKKAFIAFITAGYPNLRITEKLIPELAKSGVDILELGVPFSDPIADGAVIQEASQAALLRNTQLKHILEMVKRVRSKINIPICLMTYYNPIFCFNEEKFVRQAVGSGVDGVIIPDLPPEEAGSLVALCRKFGLDTIFFVSPTTGEKRIKIVANASRGFIYYVSLTGVTGARVMLARDLAGKIRQIKRISSRPVCAGFGVSTRAQVRQVYQVADGAIVGSAIVKEIKENINHKDLVKIIGRFVSKLSHV